MEHQARRRPRRHRATARHPAALLIPVLLALAPLACESDPADLGNMPGSPGPDEPNDPGGLDDPNAPVPFMERYALPRFLEVGDSVPLRGFGAPLQTGSFEAESVLDLNEDETAARCARGGAGWVRLRYRVASDENGVQTLIVVCVDEVGPCSGLPPVSADLEAWRPGATPGRANLLAAGSGSLYAVCRSDTGVRLQRPPPMPPPLYRIVDAWGSGPYSVNHQEMAWIRGSTIIDFSGETLYPKFVATMSWEEVRVELSADGTVETTYLDCFESPGCAEDAPWLVEGDFIILNFGANDLRGDVAAAPPALRKAFADAHLPGAWDQLAPAGEAAREALLLRLVGLEVFGQMLVDFDGALGMKVDRARVGFGSHWQARSLLTDHCLPEDRATCEAVETALASYERERIQAWRTSGFEIWWSGILGYQPDGSYRPPAPPRPDAFDGSIVLLDVGALAEPGVDRPAALANAVATFAAENSVPVPIAFSVHWGPLEHVLEINGFCEGQICPSAFPAYVQAFEPVVQSILQNVPAGRVVGFGIPMFDGGHFDIMSPYETVGGLQLNRAGETGPNNPLLNLYTAR